MLLCVFVMRGSGYYLLARWTSCMYNKINVVLYTFQTLLMMYIFFIIDHIHNLLI